MIMLKPGLNIEMSDIFYSKIQSEFMMFFFLNAIFEIKIVSDSDNHRENYRYINGT